MSTTQWTQDLTSTTLERMKVDWALAQDLWLNTSLRDTWTRTQVSNESSEEVAPTVQLSNLRISTTWKLVSQTQLSPSLETNTQSHGSVVQPSTPTASAKEPCTWDLRIGLTIQSQSRASMRWGSGKLSSRKLTTGPCAQLQALEVIHGQRRTSNAGASQLLSMSQHHAVTRARTAFVMDGLLMELSKVQMIHQELPLSRNWLK